MSKEIWTWIIWAACSLLGGVIIYFKQKRYLTEEQPLAFLIMGPVTLLIAVFCPASMFTSKPKAQGGSDE